METNLICLLDKSGSMSDCVTQTLKSYNDYIASMKDEADLTVSLYLFDNQIETIYENLPVASVPELTTQSYMLGGGTALLDALGFSVNKKRTKDEEIFFSGRNIVVVITDGGENASHEFKLVDVKSRIEQLQKENFTFVFLSADVNAFTEAASLGISAGNQVFYSKSQIGSTMKAVASSTKSLLRSGNSNTANFVDSDKTLYDEAQCETRVDEKK